MRHNRNENIFTSLFWWRNLIRLRAVRRTVALPLRRCIACSWYRLRAERKSTTLTSIWWSRPRCWRVLREKWTPSELAKSSINSHNYASFRHQENVASSSVHEYFALVHLNLKWRTVLVGCIIDSCGKTTTSRPRTRHLRFVISVNGSKKVLTRGVGRTKTRRLPTLKKILSYRSSSALKGAAVDIHY